MSYTVYVYMDEITSVVRKWFEGSQKINKNFILRVFILDYRINTEISRENLAPEKLNGSHFWP